MKPIGLLAVLLLLPKPTPANEDLNNTDVIKEYVLDSNTVYNIPVGNAPTTITFPGPLSSIDGANVSSDPANKAPVLLSHVNGRYFFSIRAAQSKAQAALNIVYKDQTYAFNFYNREGSIPYRTVRLIERKESSPVNQSFPDYPQELRKLTPTALISLLDRAKSYHVVGQAHTASVGDVEWRSPESAVTEYRDFNVAIEELFRFSEYDCIVFKIRFQNKIGDDIFYQPQTVAVRVAQNVYYPSIADASGIIPAHSESTAYIAISGKPNGERADLSLKNAFQIIVSRIVDPAKILIPQPSINMLEFIKSPLGNAIVMLVLLLLVGASVVMSSIEGKEAAATFTEADEEYNYKPDVYKRDIPRFKTPKAAEPETPEPVEEIPEEQPKAEPNPALSRPQLARQKQPKPQPAPAALPVNLFSGQARNNDGPSSHYAPYGRLVPCQLTITVESNSIDTPIIGLVTQDVVHAGQTIIPAGAEVHGKASKERNRDRIDASGTWNFVWRTQDRLNGTELTVAGIALDRELDFNTGQWGLRDGSAGLKGYLIKSDNWNEIRLFASTFLAAATQGVKDYDQFITDTGSSVQLAKSTAGNAALDGTTAVLEEYARQIRDAIERDGFYIRIPTGKQFYVYVTQTIDTNLGTRGNARNSDIWNNPNLNNEG